MRLISNEELLAVAGGDAAATRTANQNSWGEDESMDCVELSNGTSCIGSNISGSFTCDKDSGSCTMSLTIGPSTTTIITTVVGSETLNVNIDGKNMGNVSVPYIPPPINTAPIPDLIPGYFEKN